MSANTKIEMTCQERPGISAASTVFVPPEKVTEMEKRGWSVVGEKISGQEQVEPVIAEPESAPRSRRKR